MKLCLNDYWSKKLREAINEYPNFIYEIQAEFQIPGKKTKTLETSAYKCICAVMDRIDELVSICNSIDFSKHKTSFELCNLLNYSQTLIDCVTRVGKIFHVEYNTQNDISSFQNTGETKNGNDEKYFKYLRSLCSVHPVDTSGHPDYQGNQPEWCAYITSEPLLFDTSPTPDYSAIVYRNDMQFDKNVPIYLKQVFNYIEKRYNYIQIIISAIKASNEITLKKFKERHILLPTECDCYLDYLSKLTNELVERFGGEYYYVGRTWQAIFTTQYEAPNIQEVLEDYKIQTAKQIEKIHIALQEMKFQIEDDIQPYLNIARINVLDGYYYELSKLEYLFPFDFSDSKKCVSDIVNQTSSINMMRINKMLSAIDYGYSHNYSHEDIRDIGRYIDRKMHVTNEEWARVQIRIIEPFLSKEINIDYRLNNWKLFLLVQLILWKTQKEELLNA